MVRSRLMPRAPSEEAYGTISRPSIGADPTGKHHAEKFRPSRVADISHSRSNGITAHTQRVTKWAVNTGHWIRLSYHHHFGPEPTTIFVEQTKS